MNFNDFVESVQLMSIGDVKEYWHFKVKYEHTRSLWIYYRGVEACIAHDKADAVLVLRAMYKTIKVEYDGGDY